MRQHLANLLVASSLGGCSLLYNPSNIATQQDAPVPPDAPLADADPTMLTITSVAPAAILEGQGTGGSRQAIIVLEGHHIVDGATVTITPDRDTADLVIGTAMRSLDGNLLAVPVTANIEPAASSGDTPLTITVMQPLPDGGTAMSMLSGKLVLTHLPELPAMGQTIPATLDTGTLADQYSKIDGGTTGTITLVGAKRAQLRAVSSITLPNLVANGASGGSNATAPDGGPGGCKGGTPASPGQCAGGGGAGQDVTTNNGGGGGGGFADMGTQGMGGSVGGGGAAIGDPLIVRYTGTGTKANVGSGGGGGGGVLAITMGGVGGGGGGTVEVTAGGDVMVGTISANGGKGGASASGGGGGAGGVVMVRAGGTLATGTITATGGLGGGSGSTAGGAGSLGRVRWDAPGGQAPMATPDGRRGPAFQGATPLLVTTPDPGFTMSGSDGTQFTIYRLDGAGMSHSEGNGAFANSAATIHPQLDLGYNRVCITLAEGDQFTSEADKCVDVAYIPPP